MKYKVSEIANMTGVSVRTLHHYDQIALLKPEFISETKYRFYNNENLERLQQILFFKELDFSLEEIKNILDNPNFDRKVALEAHKSLLIKKKERIEEILKTVEKTINSINGGNKMAKKDMFKAFDMKDIEEHKAKYADEVKQKWGDTEAYKESEKRTSKYTKADWERIQTKNNIIYQKILDNMDKGISNELVQEAIGEWRQSITDNFYNCTPEIFRGLGEMYVSDERFSAFYEKMKVGMAVFMRDAINFYCDQLK